MLSTARSFTTRDLPGPATLGAWRDYLEQVYYRFDVDLQNTERVRGELEELRLGDLGLSRFSADRQRVHRPRSAAAADALEYYGFIFPRRSRLYIAQRGKSGWVLPGSVAVVRSSESYECSCLDDFQNVTIMVPTALVERRVSGMDDICGPVAAGNEALVRIVGNMVDELVSSRGEMLTQSPSELCRSLVSLIGAMLADPDRQETGRAVAPAAQAQFRGICAHIRAHLSDVGLDPLGVATNRRISVRHLHSLFQANGTSFGRWLLEERLLAARELLQDARNGELTILELAYRCGFVSQAHFATRYRQRFQERPRDALRKARRSAD